MESDNPSGAGDQQETAYAGSSETVRRASGPPGDETVRSSWRRGEGGGNDRPATRIRWGGGNSMPKVAKFLVG
jgi:hypothetical protein